MGGEFGRDIAAVGLGASQAFNEQTLNQMFRRRQQEEDALRTVSTGLAQQGQLHLLPSEFTQGISKRGGKELFGLLDQMSRLKEAELGPQRQIQSDVRSLLTAPVTETQVVPGQAISQAVQQAQPTAPTTQLAQAVRDLPQIREAGAAPRPEFSTQQPARTRQVQRGPTAAERVARLQGMDPLLVALATGDTSYGTLQLGTRQVSQKDLATRVAQKRLAFEQLTSAFDKAQTLVGDDGRRIRVVPIFQADGSTDLMEIGEVPESGQLARLTQKIGKQMGQLARGDALPPEDRTRIERQMILDGKALQKLQQKGGITVNNEPGTVLFDEDGKPFYIGPASKARAAAEDRRAAAIRGSTQGLKAARTTNLTGGLVMKQIQDVRDAFRPEFFGAGGLALRLTENALANVEGGQRFLEVLNNYKAGGALTRNILNDTRFVVEGPDGSIDETASRRFQNKINKRLTGEIGAFDRLLDILVINNLKLRDPSVVREGEYERELNSLTRSGASGFLAAIDVLEDDTLSRLDIAERTIKSAQEWEIFRKMVDAGEDPAQASQVLQTRDPGIQSLPVPAGELLQQRQLAQGAKEDAAQTQARERHAASVTRQLAQELGVDLQNDAIRSSVGDAVRRLLQSQSTANMTEQQFNAAVERILRDPTFTEPLEAQRQQRNDAIQGQPQLQAPPLGDELAGAPPEIRRRLDELQQRAQAVLGGGEPLRVSQIPQANLNAVIVTLVRDELRKAGLTPSVLPQAELLALGRDINKMLAERDLTEVELRTSIAERVAPFRDRLNVAR